MKNNFGPNPRLRKRWRHVQLLLKSLNTPADLLSQLRQSISLILRLYACFTSTILIASVQRHQKMQVRIFSNERITNQTKL